MIYTVNDELDFIAWIASNGLMNRIGKMYTDAEREEYGTTRYNRSAVDRIELLSHYSYGWKDRNLPEEWNEADRASVLGYIQDIAIPSIRSMRDLTLGDLV